MEDWFIDFIKRFEGFKSKAYLDKNGKYVVGYGTKFYADETPVTAESTMTKQQAQDALMTHLNKQQSSLVNYFPNISSFPKQVQYGLLNMGYRGGKDYFRNSPKFVKALNDGWKDGKLTKEEKQNIAKEMDMSQTGNLASRNWRTMAMLFDDYDPSQNENIGWEGVKTNPYTNYHLKFKEGGMINYIEMFKSGSGIHIKKSQVGSFTRYCNGKVTEECIRRGKNSPSAAIRKKATFAANSRKWRH